MPKKHRRKRNISKKIVPISYSSIVSKSNNKPDVSIEVTSNDEYTEIPIPSIYPIPRGNCGRGAWEIAYFREILELRKIFIDGMKQIEPECELRSYEFLDNFSQFLYEASSRRISPYLEPLNANLEHVYSQYTIKRNE